MGSEMLSSHNQSQVWVISATDAGSESGSMQQEEVVVLVEEKKKKTQCKPECVVQCHVLFNLQQEESHI